MRKFQMFDKPEESPVKLKLAVAYGVLELQVVNDEGKRVEGGTILQITEDGFIKPIFSVKTSFGFQLDSNGAVRVKEAGSR